MATFVHLVNMPLLFTSTALVPRTHMPGWLAAVALGNPLSIAAEVWRGALLSTPVSGMAGKMLYLVALIAAFFYLALAGMRSAARRY